MSKETERDTAERAQSARNEPFGRQPQPVRIDATGDLRDVDYYLSKIKRIIESSSYDTVSRMGNQIIIHPRAVND